MRRARAGECGRPISEGVVGGLWRAVRHHDRRRMVDVAEMHADRVPGFLVLLDQPLADRAAGGLAFRRRRKDFSALGGADEAAVVRERHLGGARRRRPPLDDRSSRATPARPSPRAVAASFQPRSKASWMPVFMPSPPLGGCACAASPARKTRPSHEAIGDRALAHPKRLVLDRVGDVAAHAAAHQRRECRRSAAGSRRRRRAAAATDPCRRRSKETTRFPPARRTRNGRPCPCRDSAKRSGMRR